MEPALMQSLSGQLQKQIKYLPKILTSVHTAYAQKV
jgi:hypothetical protein